MSLLDDHYEAMKKETKEFVVGRNYQYFHYKPWRKHPFHWTSVVHDWMCVCGKSINEHMIGGWDSSVILPERGPLPQLDCQKFEQIKSVPVGATEKDMREILIKALEKAIEKGFEVKITPKALIPERNIRTRSYWPSFFPWI